MGDFVTFVCFFFKQNSGVVKYLILDINPLSTLVGPLNWTNSFGTFERWFKGGVPQK